MAADRQQQLWTEVDAYLDDVLGGDDPVLIEALQLARKQGLPPINVSPAQGRFLATLVRMTGAHRILEIGTLGGYSTIHLARAAGEKGRVVSLEYDPHHAEVARTNLERAGVGGRVEIRVGAAAELLPRIAKEPREKFDFVFIDADKNNNRLYLEWALKLGRPGAAIVVDNIVLEGRVLEADSTDPKVVGTRTALDFISGLELADVAALQTVGHKGHDGFVVLLVPN